MSNCPNCGAPVNGYECAYCGTMFFNFIDIEPNAPVYFRIKSFGRPMLIKSYANSISVKECLTGRIRDNAFSDIPAIIELKLEGYEVKK